jgi:hypothetical protein
MFFVLNCFCGSLVHSQVQNLMFYDESLSLTLYVLKKLTRKSIICDQSVVNVQLSLPIRQSLSQRDVIQALKNILSMSEVEIIDRGDGILRAVSAYAASTCATEWLEDSTLLMVSCATIYTTSLADTPLLDGFASCAGTGPTTP